MTPAQYQGLLQALGTIPGSLVMFAGASIPQGWLACDGSAISRTTYSALFASIGTTWGGGDGSTTFNLPDLRGRCPIGVGTGGGLTARALGDVGGEENHSLSAAENGVHTHTVTDPTHTHDAGIAQSFVTDLGGGTEYVGVGGTKGGLVGQTLAAATGISIQNQGSGTGHNTMQPFAAVNFIIKT